MVGSPTMEMYKNFPERNKNNHECKKMRKGEKMAAEHKFNKKTEPQKIMLEVPAKTSSTLSSYKHVLPITLCILSFFTVISLMLFLIDPAELKHTQFRLNMSRDYDLRGVHQEDSSLITYIRDVHMKKYAAMTTNLLAQSVAPEHLNFTTHHELTPEIAKSIAELLDNKKEQTYVQSLSGSSGAMLTAPWLTETLNWKGFVVEPDPRKYFALRKDNARRSGIEVIHACLSPTGYPKEVTVYHEVGINSVLDENNDGGEGFNSRVKCFPLYSLLLAVNYTTVDVLSLGCQGQELDVLKTIPFNKVNIQVISIHLSHHFDENEDEQTAYMRKIEKFLNHKLFKLKKRLRSNYIFQKLKTSK